MKKRDVIIIVVFLAVALIGLAAFKFLAPSGNIRYADIYVNEKLYEVVPLDTDALITIDQGEGKINKVQVKDGEVFMADSTCADHICVSQGAMGPDNYENRPMHNWIICLPNMVTVELRIEEA